MSQQHQSNVNPAQEPQAAPYKDCYLEVAGIKLHYQDFGTTGKPYMICVHGGAASGHWFDFVVADFSRTCHPLQFGGGGTDIANVLTTNNDTGGGATVDDVIKTLSDIAKVASVVSVADSVINTGNQPIQRTGFDIVPVPTDWKSPVYDQSFTPIDLNSIFDNLNRLQNTQWATPKTYGGAYMGTPVNISDIVNQIMGTGYTTQSMPSNITNAVGGILGSSTTR